jgi:4-amino-4-deoxy-L-arabinose transferase-like glycosyltransferase
MITKRSNYLSRFAVPSLAAIFLLMFAAFCYHAAGNTSVTFDEPIHILAGYTYGTRDGPETLTANLRASQLWLGLPLRTLDLHYPDALKAIPGLIVDVEMKVTRDFIHDPRHDTEKILRLSRSAITALGLILGLVLFLWSRRMFGDAAGLLTLGLYCFEPTVIAHSSLATTDIAATLAFLLATMAWWRLIHRVTVGNTVLCGVATGVLAATKISGGLLAPTVAVMLLFRCLRRRDPIREVLPSSSTARVNGFWLPLALAVVAVLGIGYGVIWALYGFHYASGWRLTAPAWAALLTPQATPVQNILNFLRVHELLPEAFLYDFYTFLNNLGGRRAYLLGAFSMEGWRSYFPVALLTKTPLPTLVAVTLAIAAAGAALVGRRAFAPRAYALVPLLIFGVIYGASALASPINIGLRHLLPIYPALLVLAGHSVQLIPPTLPFARGVLVAGLIAWSAVTAWTASPHFLSYFNPAAGGTENGHRILVESNFDWGQDLLTTSRWLERRATDPASAGDATFLAYYGLGDPVRYGIKATLLPQDPDFRPTTIYDLKPGTYIISATLLQALAGRHVWGPWRLSLERVYQSLHRELAPIYASARIDPATGRTLASANEWTQKIDLFDELRFARLCVYLRARTPAARITPAVFVFVLTADELNEALDGPPLFAPDPSIKGLSLLPAHAVNFLR